MTDLLLNLPRWAGAALSQMLEGVIPRWRIRPNTTFASCSLKARSYHMTDDPLRTSIGSAIGGTAEAGWHIGGHAAAAGVVQVLGRLHDQPIHAHQRQVVREAPGYEIAGSRAPAGAGTAMGI